MVCAGEKARHLNMRTRTPQGNERHTAEAWVRQREVSSLRGPKACVIPTAPSTFLRGDVMATGRDKDRKTREKHRKNIKRMKALAKARRGSKRGKKG